MLLEERPKSEKVLKKNFASKPRILAWSRHVKNFSQRYLYVHQRAKNWLLDHMGPQGAFTLVLTNDPDHGKTRDYRRVFDALNRLRLKVTTAVFCTMEDDGSELAHHCHRGETHSLADRTYRDLMLELHEQGHEIAFHGYSQVSNTREKFIEGLEIFKETFGHYPFTYVEHGGNPTIHGLGMCKRESLAMEGLNPESPFYIWDIVKKKIGCVTTRMDLLDQDYRVKQIADLFYQRDGVLFFRRARMHYLDHMLWDLARQNGVFIGYTHFGYQGYSKEQKYRYENWTGQYLRGAIKGLEHVLKRHNVTNLTVQELAQTYIKYFKPKSDL